MKYNECYIDDVTGLPASQAYQNTDLYCLAG